MRREGGNEVLYEKNGKLYRRFDKELLCIEPYGKNGLRIRATHNHDFFDQDLSALIDPQEKAEDDRITIDGKTAAIENG